MKLVGCKELSISLKQQICEESKQLPIIPRLAVVFVGKDLASEIYVKRKQESCNDCNIKSILIKLDESISEDDLVNIIHDLNEDKSVNGILIQLPLPSHINKFKVLNEINPLKDVDCFTSTNLGLLAQGIPRFVSCTPEAVLTFLNHHQIPMIGKNVVVINDTVVVGKPLSLLLANNGATVTMCNDKTENIEQICRSASIIVTAVGKRPNFKLTREFLGYGGTTIIDVGINRVGKLILGDVEINDVKYIAGIVSAVPGGIGLLTICSLLRNTVKAVKLQ